MRPEFGVLVALWVLVCALTAGLAVVSYRAYAQTGRSRLRVASTGFACFVVAAVSSGLLAALQSAGPAPRLVPTTAFVAGFGLLYVALYE